MVVMLFMLLSRMIEMFVYRFLQHDSLLDYECNIGTGKQEIAI